MVVGKQLQRWAFNPERLYSYYSETHGKQAHCGSAYPLGEEDVYKSMYDECQQKFILSTKKSLLNMFQQCQNV